MGHVDEEWQRKEWLASGVLVTDTPQWVQAVLGNFQLWKLRQLLETPESTMAWPSKAFEGCWRVAAFSKVWPSKQAAIEAIEQLKMAVAKKYMTEDTRDE